MRGSKLLFMTSWVILLVVSVAIVLLSAQSLWVAYSGGGDALIPGYTLTQIGEHAGEDAIKAFRGRRATAASWAFGYGLLALVVTLVPYRRGEKWAWWALLLSIGLSQLFSMFRVIAVGSSVGAGTAAALFAFVLLGLLAGAPRVFKQSQLEP